MMTMLLSNGYVFWSVIGLAILAGSIYFAAADLSRTDYSSWWWRFLNGSNLNGWFWVCFFVFVCLVAVTVVLGRKADVFLDDAICRALTAADAVLLFVMVVFLFMRYCKACWGTLPAGNSFCILVLFGFIYGIVLFVTNPSIPDGAISQALVDALKLKSVDESMSWYQNIRLSDFQTYVSAMRDSDHWRVALYVYSGVCAVQLLLRNGWMHTSRLRHRIIYPVMTCLVSFAWLSVALLAGFVLCAWSLYALVVIVYCAVGLFMAWLAIAMFWSWIGEQTGGRGKLSNGKKIKQEYGDSWVDEEGRRWRNTGGDRFERID